MTIGGPGYRNSLRGGLFAFAVSALCSSAGADAPAGSASAAPVSPPPAATPKPELATPKTSFEGNSDTRSAPTKKPDSDAEPDHEVRLIMADGQLRSHTIELFATESIPRNRHPRLRLLSSHAVTSRAPGEGTWFRPLAVAPNQTRTITVAGVEQAALGTLFLFDLHDYPVLPVKPMTRVRPVLVWDDEGAPACHPEKQDNTCRVLIGEQEVNVGNPVAAYAWSGIVLLGILGGLLIACGKSLTGILQGTAGRLSLSRCQVAAWTLATGWVVMSFGLMLRASPDFPWQVAILMGLSLTTATVSYRKEVSTAVPNSADHALSDLITDDDGNVSLSRVQMLVWTVISLVLFVSKSILQGVVWPVPTELVALMGLSQAGYLLPKWIKPDGASDTAKPPPQPEAKLESPKPPAVLEAKPDAPKLPTPPIEPRSEAPKPPPKRSIPAKPPMPPASGNPTPTA